MDLSLGIYTIVTCFLRVNEHMRRLRASASEMEITVLYNLMLEVISHHFCRILLIGSNEV